ncbi:hypothetical protein CR513_11116, partial [Mucuna pruriens]
MFNKFSATCPHYQISEQLLLQYFYEGLLVIDRNMVDATSGGTLINKTLAAARHLISNMASNTQQFGIRGGTGTSMVVSEVGTIDNLSLENQLTELTTLVRQPYSSGSFSSISESNSFEIKPDITYNPLYEPEPMENNNRTLKELVTSNLELAQSYELKSGLIHLLPKFHGLAGVPHCLFHDETVRDPGRLLFSLDGVAKDRLYLLPIMFNTWGDMKRMFLKKFFSVSRTIAIQKEIYGIQQHSNETLHEFNKLCATCLHHQISEQLLLQYFYEGLLMMDRNIVDAASGGTLMDKTLAAARELISNMASKTQQFGIRGRADTSRVVSKVGAFDNLRLENQLAELTSLVRKLTIKQHHQNVQRICEIYTSVKHPTDELVFSHLYAHQITKANYSIVNPRSNSLKDTMGSIDFMWKRK